MWGLSAVSEEDRLDRVQTLKVLRRAYSMARSQRRLILSSLGFVLIGTLVTLAGPTLVRFAIDNGIKVKDGNALNRVVVLYVIVTMIGYLSGRLQYITINRAGEGFLRELRINVFDKLQKQSMSYFDREKAGVLVSRMTADIAIRFSFLVVVPGHNSALRHVVATVARDFACFADVDHCFNSVSTNFKSCVFGRPRKSW